MALLIKSAHGLFGEVVGMLIFRTALSLPMGERAFY